MNTEGSYIHGYTDNAADRLVAQANFLAPYVFDGVTLETARTLLEVGIGVGAQTRIIRRRWPQLRIVGVDIAAEQIERARVALADDVREERVELVCAPAAATSLAAASVDAAFLCFVLAHVPDPLAVLRECARVVRPGGRIFVADIYQNSFTVEPRHAVIDQYWNAMSEALRRGGGHPNLGPRLAELGMAAGLRVDAHRFVPVLGDARDRERRASVLRYFRHLCKGVEGFVTSAGAFPKEELPSLWAAWDEVERAPHALVCHALSKLEATVP